MAPGQRTTIRRMGVKDWARRVRKTEVPEVPVEPTVGVDSLADPFSGVFEAPVIPHISPSTSPSDRAALVSELRGLVQSGEYHVDAEVVAVAVMNASGQMVQIDED